MKILDIPQSGKRGLNVSQNGRYGQISRILAIPSNPQTPAQMNVRNVFATNARAWDTLTQVQRNAWITAAATHQSKTRCGTSGPLTGLQFYQQVNANQLLMGLDVLDAPPGTPVFGDLAPQGLVIAVAGGNTTLKLTCPTDPGENTVVEASPPLKQGVNVNGNYRVLGTCPAVVAGSADITALYTAKFGLPPAGTKVFVRCHLMVNGQQGVPRAFSAIVPAA
jgi:hypothetical protein